MAFPSIDNAPVFFPLSYPYFWNLHMKGTVGKIRKSSSREQFCPLRETLTLAITETPITGVSIFLEDRNG